MRRIILFSTLLLLGTACGKKGDGGALPVEAVRQGQNQLSLVVRSVKAGENPDQVLFYRQGLEEGRDRFVQMDLMRRVGRGRLAEIFGERRTLVTGNDTALDRDLLIIALGLRQAVTDKTDRLRKEFPLEYSYLEAFAAGVNQAIAEMPAKQPEVLRIYRSARFTNSPNFVPAPWEPADSVAVAQNIAFYLSASVQEKMDIGLISLASAKEKFGPALSFMLGGRGGSDPMGTEAQRKRVLGMLSGILTQTVTQLIDGRPLEDEFILNADPTSNPWPEKKKLLRGGKTAKLDAKSIAPKAKGKGKAKSMFDEFLSPLKASAKTEFAANQRNGICEERGFPFQECFRPNGVGSNNWTVSRGFAGGRSSYLANDPHLRLSYPMTFYEVALDSRRAGGNFRVRGFILPGMPGVLIGMNDTIAWGLTNLTADVNDVRFDLVTPTGDGVYVQQGGKETILALATGYEDIVIRDPSGDTHTKRYPFRRVPGFGPVISDYVPKLQKKLGEVKSELKIAMIASYRWTGHQPTSEIPAILKLDQAKDFDEYRRALDYFQVGAQNFIYADHRGNIGYYPHADFPQRSYAGTGDKQVSPLLPLIGYLGYEWDPQLREVPRLYNPSAGRIVTANNDPYGHSTDRNLTAYKDYFGFEFSTGARAKRIAEELDRYKRETGGITADQIKAIQRDHKDKMLVRMISLLEKAGDKLKDISSPAAALRDRLQAWDGVMDRRAKDPVMADQYMRNLLESYTEATAFVPASAKADMQAIARSPLITKTVFHRLFDALAKLGDGDAGVLAKNQDAAAEVLKKALEKSVVSDELHRWSDQTWGEVHRVEFYNALEGLLPSVPLPSFARDGYYDTVDVAGPGFGPNFRLVVTLTEGEEPKAEVSVPGGNYPLNETSKIAQELERWRDGGYRDLVSFQP